MNTNKVTTYFRLPSLKLTELKISLAAADKKYPPKQNNLKRAYLFGIEVEVENIPEARDNLAYWKITVDNSLRDHGYEYVSYPLRADQIEGAITELNAALPPTHSFSERTSCHVHMNVRDLTISEIYNLIIIYLVIERVLFKWVGHNRDENIFCLPLTETRFYNKITNFQENINDTIRTWNKYTALNLIPIKEKGTIEFRHMYGNLNPEIMLTWIHLLCCLKDTAKRYKTDKLEQRIKDLNTNSEYHLLLAEIFGNTANLFDNYPLQQLMEKPVSQLKLAFNRETVNINHRIPQQYYTYTGFTQQPQNPDLPNLQPTPTERLNNTNQVAMDFNRLFTTTATNRVQ